MTFATIEEIYTFKKVTFYSVRLENQSYTEVEQFILRFREDKRYKNELENILALLKIMGNEKGALHFLFRDESQAQALPPERYAAIKQNLVHFIDADLRLFCLRINSQIVVLFNGGVKESQKTQDSPDLMPKFRLAQRLCKAITQKIIDRELFIQGNILEGDFELVF